MASKLALVAGCLTIAIALYLGRRNARPLPRSGRPRRNRPWLTLMAFASGTGALLVVPGWPESWPMLVPLTVGWVMVTVVLLRSRRL